jgi:hypothetical protein
MQYALLIYTTAPDATPDQVHRPMDTAIAEVLAQPGVTAWVRLRHVESATTVRERDGRRLFSDGPFVDTKEFLGGLVMVDAPDLDAALEIAAALQATRGERVAIEVRPVLEQKLAGA